MISYGVPYFSWLPGGLHGSLVSAHMPKLTSDGSTYALTEAVPGPTDVSPLNPGVTKQTFNVPVKIENNDFLITIRSDNTAFIGDVLSWLGGSNSLAGHPVSSPSLFKGLAHGHLKPGAVRPARAAEVRRGPEQPAVRGRDQPRLADVDELPRPADRRQRPGGDLHIRRERLGAPDHGQARRLLRSPPPGARTISSRPAATAPFRW